MISLPKNLEVTFLAEKKELACTSLSEVLATIFPSNPPFRTKYGSKWKIGFLLKT